MIVSLQRAILLRKRLRKLSRASGPRRPSEKSRALSKHTNLPLRCTSVISTPWFLEKASRMPRNIRNTMKFRPWQCIISWDETICLRQSVPVLATAKVLIHVRIFAYFSAWAVSRIPCIIARVLTGLRIRQNTAGSGILQTFATGVFHLLDRCLFISHDVP